LMEKVLATYDWGENFVASNLVAKIAVDETLRQLGATARKFNDPLLSLIVDNQLLDSDRSRRWSVGVVEFCRSKDGNNEVIQKWIDKWMPLARNAIETYCAGLPESTDAAKIAIANVEAFHQSLRLSD